MPATQIAASAEIDAKHIVQRLPGRVFNAENLTITDDGRVFVTGSEAVYELAANGTLRSVAVANLPQDCMKNGIAVDDSFLYLACTKIHSGDNLLVPKSWCNVSRLEQTFLGAVRMLLAEKILCQVDSYIVRANFKGETTFDHVIGKGDATFFANGLAVDPSGMLYLANSFPGACAGIYRGPGSGDATASLELWHQRLGCGPNGVKIRQGGVFYTGLELLPVPSSVLVRVEIRADGSAGESAVVYRRLGAFFDDFDIIEDGFIIADVGDLSMSPFGSGALLFIDVDGRLVETFKHASLRHPSAVKAVVKKTGQFEKGDLLVTEKSGHCLLHCRLGDTLPTGSGSRQSG